MFKRLLVPVDLADVETARPAIRRAVAIARSSGGQIRLINVQTIVPVMYMEYVPVDFDQRERQQAERELAQIGAVLGLPQDQVSCAVRVGSIYGEVLEEATSWGAELIVIASQRPTMATYLIGSNAATIVRHALCSVLVVRNAPNDADTPLEASEGG